MDIEEAFEAHLLGNAGVTALVGERIRPIRLEQGDTLPAIIYQQISAVPEYTHDGPAGAVESRYQFTALGSSYAQAKTLKKALRAAFRPFETAPGTMAQGPLISAMFLENELDIYQDQEVETQSDYAMPLDYMVQFYE